MKINNSIFTILKNISSRIIFAIIILLIVGYNTKLIACNCPNSGSGSQSLITAFGGNTVTGGTKCLDVYDNYDINNGETVTLDGCVINISKGDHYN